MELTRSERVQITILAVSFLGALLVEQALAGVIGASVMAGAVLIMPVRLLRQSRAGVDLRPWWLIYAGIVLTFAAGVVRAAHSASVDQQFAFPSPADLLALPGFVSVLAGMVVLARSRRAFGGQRDVLDVAILAATIATPFWVFALDDYFRNADFSLLHRMLTGGYAVLEVALVAVTLRLIVGPGYRRLSFVLLGIAGVSTTVLDAVIILDTIGRPGGELAMPAVVLSFGCFALLAGRHDLARLSERPPATDPRLTATRLVTLAAAITMVPALVAIHAATGASTDVGFVLAFSALLAGLVLARVVGLLRSRDKLADLDLALRDAGQEFLTAESIEEVAASASIAIKRIAGKHAEVAVKLVSPEVEQRKPASTARNSAGAPEHRHDRGELLVYPLGGSGQRGSFSVQTEARLESAHDLALQTMANQLSMAVSAIELREATFRERTTRRLTALVEQSADLVLVVDSAGRTRFVSPNAERILGKTPESLSGSDPIEWVHEDERQAVAAHVSRPTLPDEAPIVAEARMRDAAGKYRWFDITVRDFSDDPEVAGLVITARDVTEERAAKLGLRRSEQWFRGLVQNSSDMIAVLDENGVFTYASPAVEQLLGLHPEDVQGRSFLELLPEDEVHRLDSLGRDLGSVGDVPSTIEAILPHADGGQRTLEVTLTDKRNDTSVNGIVLNVRDISDRKQLEQDLRHQVLHDDLTGLGSRVQFTGRLANALTSDRRTGSRVAVLFIDIDDFKNINDSLGHAAGDQVLVEISSRLQDQLRLHDQAARFGGDEFAVILTDIYGEGDATIVADRVVEELSRPVQLLGHEVRLSVSVGIALDDAAHQTAEDLLRAADVAMYEAKDQGKARWALFEASMAEVTVERFEISNALGAAIDNNDLRVHYQPIVDLATGQTLGVEALVRWQHPVRGMISPGSFIPLAEQNGLIVPLGRNVLEDAAAQVSEWNAAGSDVYVSVNVSAVQLQLEGVVAELMDVIDSSGAARSSVVLELTESALINDFELVMARISDLREKGVRVAIDDFGTGYSTLKYADEFSADILKIDRSFVAKLEEQERSTIISTILTIADGMGATTIAEGIELPVQHTRLLAHGCRLGQGYYFTRPTAAENITALLASEREGNALVGHAH